MNPAPSILLAICVSGLLAGPLKAQPMEALAYIRVGVKDPITNKSIEITEGSGFLINHNGDIITAKHVIKYMEKEYPGPRWIEVSLRDRDRKSVLADNVSCGLDNVDLCLINIKPASVEDAQIKEVFKPSCRRLVPEERIVALGFPRGRRNSAARIPGDITGPIATDDKYPSNVSIQRGMSGGPVIDSSGSVVAVNAGAAEDSNTFTFLQPLFRGVSIINQALVSCPLGPDPAPDPTPPPLPLPPPSPPEFSGVRVVYFERAEDENKIVEALRNKGIAFEPLSSGHDIPVNIMVCGPDTPLSAIKSLARTVIEAGAQLRVIRLQETKYDAKFPSRLTIESDHARNITQAPVITRRQIDAMTECSINEDFKPTWNIQVINKCQSEDKLNIYTVYGETKLWMRGPYPAFKNKPVTVFTGSGRRPKFWFYAYSVERDMEWPSPHLDDRADFSKFNIDGLGIKRFRHSQSNSIELTCPS